MIAASIARLAAASLRRAAMALLWVGDLANPMLVASRWCEDRAREWNPRLWSRDRDSRHDIEERRP